MGGEEAVVTVGPCMLVGQLTLSAGEAQLVLF